MKCGVCGGLLSAATTDLPFKINENTIVIVKALPILQCANCPEYVIDDKVLSWIDKILAKVEGDKELEIFRYAA